MIFFFWTITLAHGIVSSTRSTLTQPSTVVVRPTTTAPKTTNTDTGTGTATNIQTAPVASPSTAAATSSRVGFDLGSMAAVTFSIIAGVSILAL